jgi:hypothetical protein
MNTAPKTLFSAAAATAAMTAFSYIVSNIKDQNFREPMLLADYARRDLGTSKKLSKPLGWVVHYGVAIGFTVGYQLLLGLARMQPTVKNGTLFGAAAGVTGNLSWKNLFDAHLVPPRTDKKRFYAQLLVAHLIFGIILSKTTDQEQVDV